MKELLRIVFVGDSIGKTSLINQYMKQKFSSEYRPTIGTDFVVKETVTLKLQIWDTAGQEKYDCLPRELIYRTTDAFVLVYSAIDRDSFNNTTEKWLDEIRKICPNIPIILVELNGEQRELENDSHVTKIEGETLAKNINAEFSECSLQNLEQVNKLFDTVVQIYLKQQADQKTPPSPVTLSPAQLVAKSRYGSSLTEVNEAVDSEESNERILSLHGM